MSKNKIIIISIISVVIIMILGYLYLCHMSAKPGISGAVAVNGTVELVLSRGDYVKVGDDRYIFKTGKLSEIIKNEYDSYTLENKDILLQDSETIDDLDTQPLLKSVTVTKDGNDYRGVGVSVWSSIFGGKYHSVYFKPVN